MCWSLLALVALLLHRNLLISGRFTQNSRSEHNSKGDPLYRQWFVVVCVCLRQLNNDLKARGIMSAAASSELSLPCRFLL